MSSFSDDTSVLRKVALDFLTDPKNSSLFPEDEDNTGPQQQKKTQKQKKTPEANKKRQGKDPSGQKKKKKKEPELVCTKILFSYVQVKRETLSTASLEACSELLFVVQGRVVQSPIKLTQG